MKFKTSAIALAVAGTVAAPMAAQADIYASARVGIENVDTGGISDLRVRSFGSRFGAKGETDLGNGMTGFGRYEWDVDFHDSDSGGNVQDGITLRHRFVGVKGDFGSVTIGQAYHTWYNHIVGPIDNPWWGAGYAMVRYGGRTDNAITYAGGAGDISFGFTGYFLHEAAEDAPDGYELAASFGLGDMTLGLGIQHSETVDNDVTGITLSGISLGDASMGVMFQANDDDTSLALDAGFGNMYLHFETRSRDALSQDPSSLTLGYTQSLGRNTTAWYEFVSYDDDTVSNNDATVIRGVLKYDIQ